MLAIILEQIVERYLGAVVENYRQHDDISGSLKFK